LTSTPIQMNSQFIAKLKGSATNTVAIASMTVPWNRKPNDLNTWPNSVSMMTGMASEKNTSVGSRVILRRLRPASWSTSITADGCNGSW